MNLQRFKLSSKTCRASQFNGIISKVHQSVVRLYIFFTFSSFKMIFTCCVLYFLFLLQNHTFCYSGALCPALNHKGCSLDPAKISPCAPQIYWSYIWAFVWRTPRADRAGPGDETVTFMNIMVVELCWKKIKFTLLLTKGLLLIHHLPETFKPFDISPTPNLLLGHSIFLLIQDVRNTSSTFEF